MLIETHQLTRRFGPRVALRPIDFALAPGEVVALVGPNGSGKSTFLKMLAGFLRPSDGRVSVFGVDPMRARVDVMRRARFSFAPPPLYDRLTGREHLRHLARGVSREEIDRALDRVGLGARADDRVRAYSFGMRQRLALAQALLPRPELLVLDEPTDGLDPLAILELRDVLRSLHRDHGVAILLATHLITEVDALVDRLVLLHEGAVLFDGTPDGLRDRPQLRIVADRLDVAAEALGGRLVDGAVVLEAGALDLETVRARLAAAGARLHAFGEVRASLEEALLARLRAERTHAR